MNRFVRDFAMNKYLYVMMIPVIAYYAVFHYAPMYGALIAFKDYSPMKGIWAATGSASSISTIFLAATISGAS